MKTDLIKNRLKKTENVQKSDSQKVGKTVCEVPIFKGSYSQDMSHYVQANKIPEAKKAIK